MNIFISQPMTGIGEEEILVTRERAIKSAREYFEYNEKDDDFHVLDSYVSDKLRELTENQSRRDEDSVNWDVFWLSQSLSHLAFADVVWLCDGWSNSIGCQIERDVAECYGIPVIYPISDFEKEEHNG